MSNKEHSHIPPPCAPNPSGSWADALNGNPATEGIIDGLRDGLILHDSDGRVLRINRSMESMLGVSGEDAAGKLMVDLFGGFDVCSFSVPPEGADAGAARPTHRIGAREYEVDCSVMSGDAPGGPLTITVFHDVTEKVNLERQRADMLSMVSHDVRGPLTTVLGYCELILSGNMGEAGAEVLESVEAISRGGRKILDIIEDFLIVAKAEAGKLKPAFTLAPLGDICGLVMASLRDEAVRVGKHIECDTEEGLPKVECDPKLIDRIVYNLADNAVKYSKAGGGIFINIASSGEDAVVIAVRDEGEGIPADEIPHLFERYWRGSNSAGSKGSGLGLSIVRKLVGMHHGTVDVESARGRGTTFHVRLPLAQP